MLKLRNKLMLGAGAVAAISGAGVLLSSGAAQASVPGFTIVLDPILQPLLHLLLAIPL